MNSQNTAPSYLVCTIKSWNVEAFKEFTPKFKGSWHLITDKDDLTPERLKQINPRYIFFPHWSWIVPEEILSAYECVCFHMTDVPYGRGGSPLQNLIVRGAKNTKVTALRMEKELDAGPVYMKLDLDLAGAASEILERAGRLCYEMMEEIIMNEPKPEEQVGEVVKFDRRSPEMSELPKDCTLEQIYDYIRMLDAEGYPSAFIEHGDFRIEFSNGKLADESVEASVRVIKK